MTSAAFDPYHKWLGVPPHQQPPNLYRLLGISLFESDADVISYAADQRMALLRSIAAGPQNRAFTAAIERDRDGQGHTVEAREKAGLRRGASREARAAECYTTRADICGSDFAGERARPGACHRAVRADR